MFESFSKDEENVFSQFFPPLDSDEDEDEDKDEYGRDGGVVGSSSSGIASVAAIDISSHRVITTGGITVSPDDNDDSNNRSSGSSRRVDCSAISNEEGEDDGDKHIETIYQSSSYPIRITLLERLVLVW